MQENITSEGNHKRIKYLDGLRGFAILFVMLFHSYSRWPEFYPFGNSFEHLPVISGGRFGVWLFFIISGFVIAQSLETGNGFRNFVFKRWLRLFPAMLVASILIYVIAFLFPLRPEGAIKPIDFIAGISFIDPEFWKMLGLDIKSIEGSFWSLYFEVIFYFLFGAIYYIFGKKLSAYIFLIISFLPLLFVGLIQYGDFYIQALKLMLLFGFKYYLFFAAGIFFYKYHKSNQPLDLIIAIICGLIPYFLFNEGIYVFLIVPIFAFSLRLKLIQSFFLANFGCF